MPQTLYGEAAGLLQGAAKTTSDMAATAEAANESSAGLAEKSASNVTTLQQQAMAGNQAMEQKIAEAKMTAQANKEKFDRESITVTPDLAKGLAKTTGIPGLESLAGQQYDQSHFGVMITAAMKSRYARPVISEIQTDNGPMKVTVSMVEDSNGNLVPQVVPFGKAVPKPGGKGGKSTSSDWFKKAQDSLKAINVVVGKKGGIPSESMAQSVLSYFGHRDKTSDAKIATLKQNFSDYQTAVQNYNDTDEGKKSPLTIDPQVSKAMDAVLSLGDSGDEKRQQAMKILQDAGKKTSEANIKHVMDQL